MKLFPLGRIPDRDVADPRDIFTATSQPHVAIVRDVNEAGATAHINTRKGHDPAGYSREKNQKHQRFIRIEVDHHVVRIIRIVKARENGACRVISSIASVLLVKGRAFFAERVRTTFHIDLQFGFVVKGNVHFVVDFRHPVFRLFP